MRLPHHPPSSHRLEEAPRFRISVFYPTILSCLLDGHYGDGGPAAALPPLLFGGLFFLAQSYRRNLQRREAGIGFTSHSSFSTVLNCCFPPRRLWNQNIVRVRGLMRSHTHATHTHATHTHSQPLSLTPSHCCRRSIRCEPFPRL